MALYVGIDVSKEKFDACGIGDEGKKMFSLSCPMNREGFDKLILRLPARESISASRYGIDGQLPYRPVFLSYRKRLPGCHHQSSADRELRKAVLEKNEDGQEGCLYHRPILTPAEGGPASKPGLLALPNSKICPEEGRGSSTR